MALGQELKLNSGMKCAKYMLLVVSFMFAITAILLVLVGGTIQTIFGDFKQFVYERYLSPPALLMSIGFLLLIVAIFGAYGAIRESVLLINLYGLCLFVIFLLEISASLAAFIMQTQVQQMLQRTMNASLAEYQNGNVNLKNGVDFMQTTLQCCGVISEQDWYPYYNASADNNYPTEIHQPSLPRSCCREFSSNSQNCIQFYDNGCLKQLHFIIAQSTMLISTGATTVAFVQLLGSICAFMLAKTLRRHKSIREARRWQYQQSLGVLMAGNKMANAINNNNFRGYTQLDNWMLKPQDQEIITYSANSPNVN